MVQWSTKVALGPRHACDNVKISKYTDLLIFGFNDPLIYVLTYICINTFCMYKIACPKKKFVLNKDLINHIINFGNTLNGLNALILKSKLNMLM